MSDLDYDAAVDSVLRAPAAPKAPQGGPDLGYDSAVDAVLAGQTQTANRNIAAAARFTPEQAGKIHTMARDAGLPAYAVEGNEAAVFADLTARKNRDLMLKNPVLARAVANNSAFADIAFDDMQNAADVADAWGKSGFAGASRAARKVEDRRAEAFRGLPSGTVGAQPRGGFVSEMGDAAMRGLSGLKAKKTLIASELGLYRGAEAERDAQLRQELREYGSRPMPEEVAAGLAEIKTAGDESFTAALNAIVRNPRAVLEVTAESFTGSAPSLALSAAGAMAGPLGRAAGAYLGSGLVEYSSVLLDTIEGAGSAAEIRAVLSDEKKMAAAREEGVKRGLTVGLFDAITAGLAGKLLAGAKATVPSVAGRAAGELALQAVGGGAGEAAAGAWTGKFNWGDVLLEAFAEIPSSITEIPGNYSYYKSLQEKAGADADAANLSSLMDLVGKSAAKSRDPVTYGEFMSGVTADTPLYVDANELQNVLAQNKIDPATIPSLAEQLAQPSVTGDVEIPAGALMTAFAGTPAQEQIVQHVRKDQSNLSAAQFADLPAQEAAMVRLAQDVTEKQKKNEVFTTEAREIEDDFTTQLASLPALAEQPFSQRDLRFNARVLSAWYSVAADVWGVTPKQIRDGWTTAEGVKRAGWKPNILGATDTAQPTSTLSQGFDHGNAMLNVGLDVGATDRAQKIDADFVKAEIEKLGVQVLSAKEVQGEYEYEGKMVQELTYVPQLSRPLTEAEVNQLAIATGQEAIGQYDNGTGNLWGPNAANWGAFNPEFFKDQVGTKLSDAQKELAQKKQKAPKITEILAGRVVEQSKPLSAKQWADVRDIALAALTPEARENWLARESEMLAREERANREAEVLKEKAQASLDKLPKPRLSTVPLLHSGQKLKIVGTGRNGKIRVPDVGRALYNKFLGSAGDISTEEGVETVARALAHEALASMAKDGHAVGWYDRKVHEALLISSLIHPELATDPKANLAFRLIAAVTSNGQAVRDNFILTNEVYAQWKASGKFPTEMASDAFTQEGDEDAQIEGELEVDEEGNPVLIGGGQRRQAMIIAFQKLNDLAAARGWDKLEADLMQLRTVGEIKKFFDVKFSGELVDTLVPSAVGLGGPKIGNFFANLSGWFDTPTMDLWFMRTVGRMTGGLLSTKKSLVKSLKQLRKILPEQGDVWGHDVDKMRAEIQKYLELPEDQQLDPEVTLKTLKVTALYARAQYSKFSAPDPVTEKTFTDKSPANLNARSLIGQMGAMVEAPGNGTERNQLRSVVYRTLELLEKQGVKLTAADLQAVLWYHEKNLYSQLGDISESAKPWDYASAARFGVGRALGLVDVGARQRAKPVGEGQPAGGVQPGAVPGGDQSLAQLTRNAGAVAGPVVGVHYSKAPRTSLASSMAGQGMKGAEAERIAASKDPRIKQRVNFYVNTGNGITPESDVGSNPHVATLRNLYDADADALKIWRNSKGDMNVAESAVLDAGFDGYLTRNFGNQGAVVMLGNRSMDVEGISREDVATRAQQPPSPEIPKMKQAAMAIMQNRALPNGQQSVASWKRDLERSDPDTAALIAWDKIPAGDYYKDQIAGQLWQKVGAGWTKDRIDRLMSKYAYTMDDTRTKAFAAWIDPKDFISLTAGYQDYERIKEETGPLDVEKLQGETQELFLEIDDIEAGTIKVKGHEGRHRAMALMRAGVARVPITIFLRRGAMSGAESAKSLLLLPQQFGQDPYDKGMGGGFVRSVTPISYAYEDQLRAEFGAPAEILFAEAAGPRRGSFHPLTFDLRLLADANRSTFIHEASHFFMAAYIDMASQPDAPPALKQYVEDLLGYLFKNVPGGEQVGGAGLGQKVGAGETALEEIDLPTVYHGTQDPEGLLREGFRAKPAIDLFNPPEFAWRGMRSGGFTDGGGVNWYGPTWAWWRSLTKDARKRFEEEVGEKIKSADDLGRHVSLLFTTKSKYEATAYAKMDRDAKGYEVRQHDPIALNAEKIPGILGYYQPDINDRGESVLVLRAGGSVDLRGAVTSDVSEYLAQNGEPATPGAIPEGRTNIERWNAMTLDQQRAYWEFFAEGFEQYAMSGKAPTKALQSAFSAFAKWMKEIYKTLKAFVMQHGTKPLDAELTQYFDRMLATDEELDAARAERGFQALFKNLAESGMSPGQFADYMALDELQKTEAEELLRARSIRDMKWLSGAKSRAIAEIQAEADELRNLVRASVEEELANTPIRRVERWLKKGEMKVGDDEIAAQAGHRLDMAVVKAMFPEGAIAGQIDFAKLGRGKNALAASTGTMHPDTMAEIANEQFGGEFRNGEDLVRQLIDMPAFKDEVSQLTDLQMLEEHGDLATPEAIAKAADVAIHNDAHLKMLATELWALNNRTGSVAALTKAAKAFAQNLVDGTVVKKLRPVQFVNAATRAGKAVVRAHAKGELDKAATEKRTEVVNAAAAKAAYAAEAEVRAIMNRLRKISAYSDKHSSVMTREFSVVQAVRAILSEFEIGSKGEKAGKYLELVQEYDPTLGAVLDATIKQLAPVAKPWDQLKVAELRELREAVDGLWRAAKEVRTVELNGERMDLDAARARLLAQIEKIPAKARKSKAFSLTKAEQRNQKFMSTVAKGIRPETLFAMMDGTDEYGEFTQLIWNTINDAQLGLNTEKEARLRQLKALLEPIMADMTDVKIDAPELGGTFGEGHVIGYSELLHAILHSGNLSNLERLLVGRGWGSVREDGTLDTTKWDAFMKRMFAEGKITKKHMDFVQATWDLLEELKPAAQAAHRATTGRFFPEIEAKEIVTPFGVYRGGYAPAIADRGLAPAVDMQAMLNDAQQDVMQTFEKPWAGFAKERTTTAAGGRPLELNIAALGRHIDSVLVFSHMSVPIRNVQRVLKGDALSKAISAYSPEATANVIAPWLHSAAVQSVTEKGKHSAENMAVWTKLRSRAGMAVMFANISNSIQQLTGFFPALALISKKEMLFAAAKGWYQPKALAASVAEMSPYMAQRLDNEAQALADEIDQILLNPTKLETAQAWANRHAYFLQMSVDMAMSPVIWQARFNQTMAEGTATTPEEVAALQAKAIHMADSAVRMTQGSNRAIDVAAIEKGSPLYRLFLQFAGWANSQANLLGMKLAREKLMPNTPAKYGRITSYLALIWWAPAIASMIVAVGMRGGPDDDDGDGLWDDWLTQLLLAPVKMATSAVPFVGPALMTAFNAFNDKPYDDKMSVSPVISLVEGGFRGTAAAAGAIEDPAKTGRAIRDLGAFFSLFTGVPITPATKAIGYATDVETGKVSPTGPVDYGRGIITGVASPESKAR